MILVTGGFGKIGTSINEKIKNKRKILIKRSNKFIKINDNTYGLNLENPSHLRKITKKYNFKHLIHLSVTRNPITINKIRNFNTLKKDTLILLNLLEHLNKLKKIIFISSASIYKIGEVNDKIERSLISEDTVKFLNNKKSKQFIIKTYQNVKRKKLNIDPLYHKNENKRLNGSNKLINEILLMNFCYENNVKIFIARPFRISETKIEKDLIKKKIKIYQK